MGQAVSTIRQQVEQADTAEQDRLNENLHKLEELAEVKLSLMRDKIALNLEIPCAVPIKTMMRFHSEYKIDVSKQNLTADSISDSVGNFFDGKLLEGCKKLIGGAVHGLLSSNSGGGLEKREYFIVMYNDTICRIDSIMYSYKSRTKGLVAFGEDMMCFVYSIALVDKTKVDKDALVFLVTEQVKSSFVKDDEKATEVNVVEKNNLVNAVRQLYIEDQGMLKGT